MADDAATDGERHCLHLLELGFPEEVAAEAGRAGDLGLFELTASPDLVDRVVERVRATGIWDRPPLGKDGTKP